MSWAGRDMEMKIRHDQQRDVIHISEPTSHDRRRQFVCVGLGPGQILFGQLLQMTHSSSQARAKPETSPLGAGAFNTVVTSSTAIAFAQ